MRDPAYKAPSLFSPRRAAQAAATVAEAVTAAAAKFRYLREYWRPSVLASQRVYGLSLLS